MNMRAILKRTLGVLIFAIISFTQTVYAENWQSDLRNGIADWQADGTPWGLENQEFLTNVDYVEYVFRVHMHAGGIDPATMRSRGLPLSGSGFKGRMLAGGSSHVRLRYRLRFPADFQFVRGGKLPGLFGGRGNSGGDIPNGTDGFSFRLMWLDGGKGRVYAYLPTSQTYGTPLFERKIQFQRGKWHRVTQELHLNTPGFSDGYVRMWIDGEFLGAQTGLMIRTVDSLKIEGVFFDVFYGGNDDSWAPTGENFIDFADFELNW